MNRRTTFSTARWAGLVALGVAFGLLLTSSLQPRALGQTKYENFKCKETTCFDGGCYPGGGCGECLGGLYSPFYMCILDPGYECTPDEGVTVHRSVVPQALQQSRNGTSTSAFRGS